MDVLAADRAGDYLHRAGCIITPVPDIDFSYAAHKYLLHRNI